MIARPTKPRRVQRQDHMQRSFGILQLFLCLPAGRGGEEEEKRWRREKEASGHWPSPRDKLSSPAAASPPGLSLPTTTRCPGWTCSTIATHFAEQWSGQGRRLTAAKAACFPTGQKWSRFAFCKQDASRVSSLSDTIHKTSLCRAGRETPRARRSL